MTNGDQADDGAELLSNGTMALLGALAAAGNGRRGCVLRVAADAITFYCGGGGGGVGGDGGGDVDAVADVAAADDDGGGGGDALADLYGIYGPNATGRPLLRPVRSAADVGYATDAVNGYAADAVSGYAADAVNGTLLRQANATAGALYDGFVTAFNGSAAFDGNAFNGTAFNGTDAGDAQTITNYIFVVTIGIILGAMILTTICGEYSVMVCWLW